MPLCEIAVSASLLFALIGAHAGAVSRSGLPIAGQSVGTLAEEIEKTRKAGLPVSSRELNGPLPPERLEEAMKTVPKDPFDL